MTDPMITLSLAMRSGTLHSIAPRHPDGSRALVLLLHGGHGSWRHWRANIAPLSALCDPLALDMPGYGESDDAMHGASLSEYAAMIDDALRGLPPVAVVAGFSFGTLVATELARRWQDTRAFRGAVLINPPLGADVSQEVLEILEEGVRATRRGGLEAGVEVTQRRIMLADPAGVTDELIADAADQVRRTRFKSRPLSRSIDIREQMRALVCPVELLLGARDPHQRAGLEDRLPQYRALLGANRVHVVERAAHWLAFEYPERLTEAVAGLLEGAGGRVPSRPEA